MSLVNTPAYRANISKMRKNMKYRYCYQCKGFRKHPDEEKNTCKDTYGCSRYQADSIEKYLYE